MGGKQPEIDRVTDRAGAFDTPTPSAEPLEAEVGFRNLNLDPILSPIGAESAWAIQTHHVWKRALDCGLCALWICISASVSTRRCRSRATGVDLQSGLQCHEGASNPGRPSCAQPAAGCCDDPPAPRQDGRRALLGRFRLVVGECGVLCGCPMDSEVLLLALIGTVAIS